jgi:peptidoglycan/LPS O-acetylase OafA/YrhL
MPSKPALPNLTTLRFLAALYVFIFHFGRGTPISNLGNTGVSLFFVLSGFILAYNHPQVSDRRRFIILRLARIYPLYAVSLLTGLGAFVATQKHHPVTLVGGIVLSFTLLQTWVPSLRGALNPVGWTLPVEFFFYACFPPLLPLVVERLPLWKRWIAILATILLLPSLIVFFWIIPTHPEQAMMWKEALMLPVFRLGEFVIGMFLGLRFLRTVPTFTTRHVTLSTLLVVVSTAFARHIPWFYLELILNGLLAVPYAILIYTLAGWRSRWFGHPILQLGGEISFGMYLLQIKASSLLRHVMPETQPGFMFVLLLLTMALAYLGYILIEKPARRWVVRLFGYHATAKPIPTPGLTV